MTLFPHRAVSMLCLVRLRIANFKLLLTIHSYLTEPICYQFLPLMLRTGFQFFPHQHMDPPKFQVALKLWLGMDLAQGLNCTFCPSLALNPLGHHAITSKHGGDVVSRHNKLCDAFVECCRRANVSAQVEVGSGFGHDKCNTRPADVLVPNWSLGKPAAFDLTVTSPLNPCILSEAGVTAGSAAKVAQCRKHDSNNPKCSELSWKCTPLAVVTYGVLRLGKHYHVLPLGHTHEVHQVQGHCFHLWQTQPHFGEVLCKSSSVKS